MRTSGKRIGRLLGASERKTQPPPYRHGLQAMWAAHRLHTRQAEARPVRRGVRGLTPGGARKGIHRSW